MYELPRDTLFLIHQGLTAFIFHCTQFFPNVVLSQPFASRVRRETPSWAPLDPRDHLDPRVSGMTAVQEPQAPQDLPDPLDPPLYRGPTGPTTVSIEPSLTFI